MERERQARRIVINADDFGMTDGVSRGIARAFDEGLVSSASLLANYPGFEKAVQLAQARPGLSVGLHLDLTDGAPLSPACEVSSLVDSEGHFLGYRTFSLRLLSGRIVRTELRREIEAQLDRLIAAGLAPTHVDGHRHIHLLPLLFDVVAAAVEARGVTHLRCPAGPGGRAAGGGLIGIAAMRQLGFIGFGRLHHGRLAERGLSTADVFLGAANRGSATALRDDASRFDDLPVGLTEWMVHPGEVDAELVFVDDTLWKREQELAYLCSAEAAVAIDEAGLSLVNFRGEPKLALLSRPRPMVA